MATTNLCETYAQQQKNYFDEAEKVYTRSVLRELKKQGLLSDEEVHIAKEIALYILSGGNSELEYTTSIEFVMGYEKDAQSSNGYKKTENWEIRGLGKVGFLIPLPKNSKTMGLLKKAHQNGDAACLAAR